MVQRAMIETDDAIQRMIRSSDHMKNAYGPIVAYWSPETPPITCVFEEFGSCLCTHAVSMDRSELANVLSTIEELLVHGTQSVKEAVATGALECILHTADTDAFDIAILLPFLGRESKEYCRAWDEFTGVKTKGLW